MKHIQIIGVGSLIFIGWAIAACITSMFLFDGVISGISFLLSMGIVLVALPVFYLLGYFPYKWVEEGF